MAGTETIYNPLIKKGFQEMADVGSIQAALNALQNAVNALQGNKVTKITDSSQLSTIEENEIIQWQTDNATIDGKTFKNGYFYKCTTNSITLPTGTQYFENGIDEVNLYGYDVRPGNFYVVEDNTPAASNDFFNLRVLQYNSSPDYLFLNYAFPTVGEAVWNRATNEVVTVQSVDENLSLHLSDGNIVITTGSSNSHPYKLYKVLDENDNYFNVADCSPMGVYIFMPNYVVNGNSFTVNDWFCIRHYNLLTTVEPTEIGQNTFAQTNTQQQQLSVVDNIVKYTLNDEVTILDLAQLSDIPAAQIDYDNTLQSITNLFSPNDTLVNIITKIWNIETRLMQGYFSKDGNLEGGHLQIPFLSWRDTSYNYNEFENLLKWWVENVNTRLSSVQCTNVNITGVLDMDYRYQITGAAYGASAGSYPENCNFIARPAIMAASNAIALMYFGVRLGTWYYFTKTL